MSKQDRRLATEEKLLRALREILADQGFRGVGVNAVARRAGVSKELIYRYFGGIDELLRRLMGRHDFWAIERVRVLGRRGAAAERGAREQVLRMLTGQMRQLREQPDLQEIRRWELIDSNELTLSLAEAREEASLEFLAGLDPAPDEDGKAMVGVLLAGVLYLALRSKTAPSFFGIPLEGAEGARRLEAILGRMVDRLLAEGEAPRDGAAAGDGQPGRPEGAR